MKKYIKINLTFIIFDRNIQSTSNNANVNTMTFNNEEDGIQDIFEVRLIEWCQNRSSNEDYGIFEADEIILKSLSEREVFYFL